MCWPDLRNLNLGWTAKCLAHFVPRTLPAPVSGMPWQARARLFKKSEIWVLDEWAFICSNSHLSWTFLVSLYPQAPKLFYLLRWDDTQLLIGSKRPTVKCSLAYTQASSVMYLWVTKKQWYLFQVQNYVLTKKKKSKSRWIKIGHEFQLLKLIDGSLEA